MPSSITVFAATLSSPTLCDSCLCCCRCHQCCVNTLAHEQAFPGYILLLMPIIYGVTGCSPFNTEVAEFFLYFTPMVVSAMLPTLISARWRGVDSDKLQRDEQVRFAITCVSMCSI